MPHAIEGTDARFAEQEEQPDWTKLLVVSYRSLSVGVLGRALKFLLTDSSYTRNHRYSLFNVLGESPSSLTARSRARL